MTKQSVAETYNHRDAWYRCPSMNYKAVGARIQIAETILRNYITEYIYIYIIENTYHEVYFTGYMKAPAYEGRYITRYIYMYIYYSAKKHPNQNWPTTIKQTRAGLAWPGRIPTGGRT